MGGIKSLLSNAKPDKGRLAKQIPNHPIQLIFLTMHILLTRHASTNILLPGFSKELNKRRKGTGINPSSPQARVLEPLALLQPMAELDKGRMAIQSEEGLPGERQQSFKEL